MYILYFNNILTAKKLGLADGKYYLGYLYEKGIGTRRRPGKALALYRKVADLQSDRVEDQYAIRSARTRLGILIWKGSA